MFVYVVGFVWRACVVCVDGCVCVCTPGQSFFSGGLNVRTQSLYTNSTTHKQTYWNTHTHTHSWTLPIQTSHTLPSSKMRNAMFYLLTWKSQTQWVESAKQANYSGVSQLYKPAKCHGFSSKAEGGVVLQIFDYRNWKQKTVFVPVFFHRNKWGEGIEHPDTHLLI